MLIEDKYKQLCEIPSDSNLHLPLMRKYVAEGDTVIEFGVRYVNSTWALLANKPKKLWSVDIVRPPEEKLAEVEAAAKEQGTEFAFLLADSHHTEIDGIDILFIDTIHTYSHLVKELWAHSSRVRKYIILHDSEIPEMKACIFDFLFSPEWELAEEDKRKTGCCVLKRIC